MTDAERIAELEEEVARLSADLKFLIGDTDEDPRVLRLQQAFGISHACAKMLFRLYGAKGEAVSHHSLLYAATKYPEVTGQELVKVQVHHLRKGFGFHKIETVWGHGYRLTPEGINKVRAALGEQTASEAA